MINGLTNIKVQHTKRACNCLACAIAQLALDKLEPHVWLGQYLPLTHVFILLFK